MPDPTAHHPTMLRIDDTLPPLWWLNPWRLCRQLHTAVRAMQRLGNLDDDLHQFHLKKIYELCENINERHAENAALRARVDELEAGLDRLHAAIITGGAIVPDAKPEEEPSK